MQEVKLSIITISRGSYSKGKEIAEKVAAKLGYECISRDIILAASERFNIPEIKLIRAIHDSPSILERFSRKKTRYINYVQTALLKHFRKDNIVYHGLAGHFFVKLIPHVLKIRIIADTEQRIQLEMRRENISYDKAKEILKKDDEERRKWSQDLYGIDTCDPCLYDLVIHIRKIRVDDAVDIICHTVKQEHFQTTPESQKAIEDLTVASEVKMVLFDDGVDAEVTANDGVVEVKLDAPIAQEQLLNKKITKTVSKIKGVKTVHAHVVPTQAYAG